MTKAETAYESIAKALAGKNGVAASQMFGMPTLKVRGKAFAGLADSSMVFKLAGAHHASALALRGAKLFEPMAGRQMREWAQVPVAHVKVWKRFAERARDYVSRKA
jgi:hypothetical protein